MAKRVLPKCASALTAGSGAHILVKMHGAFARPGRSGGTVPEKCMGVFAMEHGKAAYRADFGVYGSVGAALANFLFRARPHSQRIESLGLVWVGLAGWTAIEYLLHRFVLQGLAPFKRWHEEHRQRPRALIPAEMRERRRRGRPCLRRRCARRLLALVYRILEKHAVVDICRTSGARAIVAVVMRTCHPGATRLSRPGAAGR